jgi:hypothetical protein
LAAGYFDDVTQFAVVFAFVVLALVLVGATGRARRPVSQTTATDGSRDLGAMRRRMRVVCWCILPIAAGMCVLAVSIHGAARAFLLVWALIPAATASYLLLLLAAKGRRGTLPQ